jgi:hypothetical protein
MAGINAALKVKGEAPLVLDRTGSLYRDPDRRSDLEGHERGRTACSLRAPGSVCICESTMPTDG